MTAFTMNLRVRVQCTNNKTYTYEGVTLFNPSDGFLQITKKEGNKLITIVIPMKEIVVAVCESELAPAETHQK